MEAFYSFFATDVFLDREWESLILLFFFFLSPKVQNYLVAHPFERVEYRIFFVVFYYQMQLKKSKQIFAIRHVQLNELQPRTLAL